MNDLPLSIVDAADQLRDGTLTSVELTRTLYARADVFDPLIGTYLARFDDHALESAERADDELSRGIDRGPLHGIPLGLKDIIASAEGPTTAQSLVLDRAWAEGKDAPVVSRLRAGGAVIMGKTTTAEFAHGAPDATKPFPLPRNPWDLGRYPGGSSSGTASGIAAGLLLGGLGTDTGGSIRGPASYCGITGLKPTFGLVPKSGCVPLANSMDHVGPMARTTADVAIILQAIAGHHRSDPQSSRHTTTIEIPEATSLEGVRIGVDHVQPPGITNGSTVMAFESALQVLESLGAEIVEVTLPLYEELIAIVAFTRFAEAFAYHREDLRGRWSDYGATTRVNLTRGALISGAEYVQAQRVRRVGLRLLDELFGEVDLVASPTVAAGAPAYSSFEGEFPLDGVYQRYSNTSYWSPTGRPVLALPMGFTDEGLPVSLQLAGKHFAENDLLAAGNSFQQVTDWHRRVPPLLASAGVASS
jgi:aspartyl-tRNA(Asn)/glutamyl-tRNA(Gln) amidotransferase subunit A